jgi:hypothetical protein
MWKETTADVIYLCRDCHAKFHDELTIKDARVHKFAGQMLWCEISKILDSLWQDYEGAEKFIMYLKDRLRGYAQIACSHSSECERRIARKLFMCLATNILNQEHRKKLTIFHKY